MVMEIEKFLVELLHIARKRGVEILARCCELSGVGDEVSSPAYAPDVAGDTEEALAREMDRMVNDYSIPIEKARLIRLYLAANGDLESQCSEGYNFANGRNIPQDYEIARYWYEKAAERGHAYAQNALAVLYADGKGGAADPEKAVYWYMRSASGGYSGAIGNLAEYLVRGRGVSRRHQIGAATLLFLCIDRDPHNARYHLLLAEYYERIRGGNRGIRQARFCYKKASNLGSEEAREALHRLADGED